RTSCPASPSPILPPLWLDPHAAPERHVILDLARRVLRGWIVPGRILVGLPVDHDVVVAGHPLPGTGRVHRAVAQVLPSHRVRRKVVVALDHLGARALREHGAVPDRLRHWPLRLTPSFAEERLPGNPRAISDPARGRGPDGCCTARATPRRSARQRGPAWPSAPIPSRPRRSGPRP